MGKYRVSSTIISSLLSYLSRSVSIFLFIHWISLIDIAPLLLSFPLLCYDRYLQPALDNDPLLWIIESDENDNEDIASNILNADDNNNNNNNSNNNNNNDHTPLDDPLFTARMNEYAAAILEDDSDPSSYNKSRDKNKNNSNSNNNNYNNNNNNSNEEDEGEEEDDNNQEWINTYSTIK